LTASKGFITVSLTFDEAFESKADTIPVSEMSAIFRKPVQKPNPLAESRNNHLEKAQSISLISQYSLLDHPPIIIPSLAANRPSLHLLFSLYYPFNLKLRQSACPQNLLLSTETCTIIVLYNPDPLLQKNL